MAKHVSRRAYARMRKLNEAAVRRALARGAIHLERDGLIDPARADREWKRNTDPSKPRARFGGDRHHRKKPGEPSTPAAFLDGGDEDVELGPSIDLETEKLLRAHRASRALSENYRAKSARLAYERLEGRLVDVDEVASRVFRMFRRARDLLLAMPDRLAADLAGADPETARRLITEEIDRCLAEISVAQALPAGARPSSVRKDAAAE